MLSTSRGTQRPNTFRRLNTPRGVEVQTDTHGEPLRVRLRGRWFQISLVRDHYRTEDRWWTAEPVSRAYYELLLEDGRVMTVFRDENRGEWWEQRYQ